MACFIVLLAALCACVGALDITSPFRAIGSVVGKVGDEIVKDVADIKQPIEEGVTFVVNSQCSNAKKMLKFPYQAMGGKIEPRVSDLTLVFRTSQVTVTYNITTAAQLIPKTTGFNPDQKLYIFIHGFTSSPLESSFDEMRNALLSQGNINVLALDASTLINWLYLRASTYVTYIGQQLGEVLAEMVEYGVDPAQIHIMGHSLGSHIAGFAGKQFHNKTGRRVRRISALDPAGPCFLVDKLKNRLHKSDADFIDVIHTNAGVLGLKERVGHVDYWPNDGSAQTDCLLITCSHERSWMYYAESIINPKAFPAIKCDSWNAFKKGNCSDEISYMGFPSDSSSSGNYYLRTAGESPFGLGINGSVYDDSDEGLVTKLANLVL